MKDRDNQIQQEADLDTDMTETGDKKEMTGVKRLVGWFHSHLAYQ